MSLALAARILLRGFHTTNQKFVEKIYFAEILFNCFFYEANERDSSLVWVPKIQEVVNLSNGAFVAERGVEKSSFEAFFFDGRSFQLL